MKPDAVAIVGGLMVALGIYVLWRAHKSKNNNVNIEYLLVEGSFDPPRVTLSKFIGLGGWCASTWWISYIVFAGKYDPTSVVVGYIGVCLAAKVATDMVNAKAVANHEEGVVK